MTLSEDSRKLTTSQNKKRLKSAKILCWFFTPFAILSIYACIKVAQEGGVSSLLAERGGIAGIIFVICAVFVAVYFLLCLAKLRPEIEELPEFQISIVEGVPKLKEGYYRHSFRAPATGAIYGATQQISFTGTINGIKYNLWAVSPNMIGSAPMRFIAITRRSWLFLCDWKNFVIEIQELSAEEIKKYEDNQWLGLLAGSVFLMSISGWYLFAGDKNISMIIVIMVLLVVPALITFGASVYCLIVDIFSKSVARLTVQSFIGAVKKNRPATYSEYQQSGRELITAPTIIFGGKMYFVLPESLFDKIPTTREMKYFYVQKDKIGAIINFTSL
ncbi:MAG: hypothetical protein HZC26_03645 [Candidatus Magasanikbacteria bacterium]|nr:hypothetical protein [Candidatus Magasanikbacteria bacterium]